MGRRRSGTGKGAGDGARDAAFWGKWLARNAERLSPEMEGIRDWFRAAGVGKGERRHFKAALKAAGLLPARRRGERTTPVAGEEGRRRRDGGRPPAEGGPAVEGRLKMSREGRLLLVPDEPGAFPVRVSARAAGGALPRDRVVVRLERRRGGAPPYGRVVRILSRGIREFVGRYAPLGDRPFVRLRDRESDLRLPATVPEGIRPEAGELVLARVDSYPAGQEEGSARILRTMGHRHTMETICLAVTAVRGIPAEFSGEAAREAARIPQTVRAPSADGGPAEGDLLPRVDQRHLPFVTIDGEDARDFDDAVCLLRERGQSRLFVAIADVSRYVLPDSAIDRDAYERGTSVYFPDRCIPMLPPELSEGVCSLNPGVNRLAVTAEIPIPDSGRPGEPSFRLSVIRSRARLTYDEVHRFLDGSEGTRSGGRIGGDLGEMLGRMRSVAGQLILAREARGALDFDLPETKIAVRDGIPADVAESPRWESHRIIEEFMLLANAAVAAFLSDRGLPFLFRIHEPPEERRVEEFEDAAARLLRRTRVTDRRDLAGRLQAWADAARGGKYERYLHFLLLRSLMLARYGPEAIGHFGLALARYTHFTSPIRRYPDLIVHRALKGALGDTRYLEYLRRLDGRAESSGAHLSARERAADEAERDVEQRAKALFLSGRVGESFTGRLFSHTRHGFFVRLEEIPVDGFVPIHTLRDDEYRFSEDRQEWVGVFRRSRLGLADRLRVRLFRSDPDRGEIDLQLIEKLPESP